MKKVLKVFNDPQVMKRGDVTPSMREKALATPSFKNIWNRETYTPPKWNIRETGTAALSIPSRGEPD